MEKHWFKSRQALFLSPVLLLLIVAVACGGAAEPTAAPPTATSAPAPTAMPEAMEEPSGEMMADPEKVAFAEYWTPPTDYYGQPVRGDTLRYIYDYSWGPTQP